MEGRKYCQREHFPPTCQDESRLTSSASRQRGVWSISTNTSQRTETASVIHTVHSLRGVEYRVGGITPSACSSHYHRRHQNGVETPHIEPAEVCILQHNTHNTHAKHHNPSNVVQRPGTAPLVGLATQSRTPWQKLSWTRELVAALHGHCRKPLDKHAFPLSLARAVEPPCRNTPPPRVAPCCCRPTSTLQTRNAPMQQRSGDMLLCLLLRRTQANFPNLAQSDCVTCSTACIHDRPPLTHGCHP